MHLELTISGPGGTHDVAITAPGDTLLADVLPGVAALVGGDSTAVWHGERLLDSAWALGGAGLQTGAHLSAGHPRRIPSTGVLALQVVGGARAGRILPLGRGVLTIGRSASCDVQLDDDHASRCHATLGVVGQSLVVHDLDSTNGTLVDGVCVGDGGRRVRAGQLIRIGDTLLTVCGPDDAPATTVAVDAGRLVSRPPRYRTRLDTREILVPQRRDTARPRSVQWVTALVPAVAGAAIAWWTGSPEFLLFTLLSPLMMMSGALGDRMHWRRSRRREAATFAQRSGAAAREIVDGLALEAAQRRAASPDPAALRRIVAGPSSRVWERRATDDDMLSVRLGSAAIASALRARSDSRVTPAGVVRDAPLCVDLRRGPLGLTGPADVLAGCAPSIVAQLAALHSPRYLELSLFLTPATEPAWRWARWLPHMAGRVAVGTDEWQAAVNEFAALVAARRARYRLDPAGWRGPWTVLVVDRAAAVRDVPGLSALLESSAGVGLTGVFVDPDEYALPSSCVSVARSTGDSTSRLVVAGADAAGTVEVVADLVTAEWAEEISRALAPLVDAEADGASAIPASCRLRDVLGIEGAGPDDFIRRWAASDRRASTVLGIGADGPVRVDLVADGPHALVAGTTGAGKSELLQTLVAGLATGYPPDEVAFLLIDYKGGAAFGECAQLPHTVGLVTDLDPHLTTRALRSLHAELRRREQLFATAAVAELDDYRAGDSVEPLARLVIVVDEFAALADELPDFVRGLVAVAQRGRSLGVHLVLATQRPGSAVSPEIRANTALRIALRVTDPAESTDVIDTADAAGISRTTPGRAYLRVGSNLQCLQTARVRDAARSGGRITVATLDHWRRTLGPISEATAESDLSWLVGRLRAAATTAGSRPARSPWLDPLSAAIPVQHLEGVAASFVGLGVADLPSEQRRATIGVDLERGSAVLVVGAQRSGRTLCLSTAALQAARERSPAQVHVYVVDATGRLADDVAALPHVATCLGPHEVALLPTLLTRLQRVVSARVADAAAVSAAMLLLIDGWDAVLGRLDDVSAARCGDLFSTLLRTGGSAGLTALVTGDRTLLAPRFASMFDERLVLRLGDRADYGLVGVRPRDVPASMPPGRGVRASDGAEIQIAHAGRAPDAPERRRVAEQIVAASAGLHPGSDAVRIRALPGQVSLTDLPADSDRFTLGLGGDTAMPIMIDPFAGAGRMLIAGPPRSGRSTTLASLLEQAERIGLNAIVAAGSRSPLLALARDRGSRVVLADDHVDELGKVPTRPTMVLVDDSEALVDTAIGERLTAWLRVPRAPIAIVVAGRSDDLATTYRGVAAEVRRSHCGLLLRPGPLDGELLGVRLPRQPAGGPPGRGVLVGDPTWGPHFAEGEPVPIQVARP